MDIRSFKKSYKDAKNKTSKRRINILIKKSMHTDQIKGMPDGYINLIILMEELAELQQQISKILRGKSDRAALLEEYADVVITLNYVKKYCKLTQDEINRSVNVKLDRLESGLKTPGKVRKDDELQQKIKHKKKNKKK